jgi:hypothetical protein
MLCLMRTPLHPVYVALYVLNSVQHSRQQGGTRMQNRAATATTSEPKYVRKSDLYFVEQQKQSVYCTIGKPLGHCQEMIPRNLI